MTAKHPTFLVKNGEGSSYLFRSIIPRDLRERYNYSNELRISLKTGIKTEAKRLAHSLKIQLDRIFDGIRSGNISETCVISIKNELKDYRDGLLLPSNKEFGACIKKSVVSPPPNWTVPPPRKPSETTYFEESMKLPPEYKLVKEYVSKFKYGDIIEFCESNDIEYPKGYFPKRYIRRCRENLIKLIDEDIGLGEVAGDFAYDIIENYLASVDFGGFKAFLSRYEIDTREIKDLADIPSVVKIIGEELDLVEIALKLGIKYLEPEEDETGEVSDGSDEGGKEDPLKKMWDNIQTTAAAAEEEEPEEQLEPMQPTSVQHQQSSAAPKRGPLISSVVEEYFEEMKAAQVWSDKTEMEKRSTIGKFVEIIGDIKVDKISHEVARKYKRTLMKLPSNMRKDPRYRDLSIKEILGLKEVKPIAINTVNNNISTVTAFMSWARNHGYIAENYFVGLKVPSKKKAQDERKPFTTGDLKRIFDPDLYRKETSKSPAKYWVPLLGLFTGARINELCQLHVEDVKQEDGIWCLDINDEGDDPENPKKLKNLASARVIPIHPKLIKLGFIDYVKRRRRSKKVRLFPELSLRIDGFSRQVGRWFNESYLKKKVGITDKVFHSFRHTVADGLKQKGVRESYISEFLGHVSGTGDSETFGRYGKQYRPGVLMEEVVQRIEYGLDFQVLKKIAV